MSDIWIGARKKNSVRSRVSIERGIHDDDVESLWRRIRNTLAIMAPERWK